MVVPIRDLVNKSFHSSASNLQTQQMTKIPSNIDMDVNANIIRGRSTFSSKINSRELLVLSDTLSYPYHEKMEARNNILDEKIQDPINNS